MQWAPQQGTDESYMWAYVGCVCVCLRRVYVYVCLCVWGLPCSGHWLNCFHMCLNAEFWAGLEDKGGEGAAVVGGDGGGGVRFHSTMQHIWAARAELDFPRLKTHSLHTLACVCAHLDEPRSVHKHLWSVSSEHTHDYKHRTYIHTRSATTHIVQAATRALIYVMHLCLLLFNPGLSYAWHTHSHACSPPHTHTRTLKHTTSSLAQLSQMLRAHGHFTGTTHGRKIWMCSH